MRYLKITFGTDGSATAHTSIETTQVRGGQNWRPNRPWFISDLEKALELKLADNNTKIVLSGFPPTTLAKIREAWEC